MGNTSPYGIERLFDKSIKQIDLRKFTKTDSNGLSNVFFYTEQQSGYEYLFVYHIDMYICLGKIIKREILDNLDNNVLTITVDTKRKYVVSTWLNYHIFNGEYRILSQYMV